MFALIALRVCQVLYNLIVRFSFVKYRVGIYENILGLSFMKVSTGAVVSIYHRHLIPSKWQVTQD